MKFSIEMNMQKVASFFYIITSLLFSSHSSASHFKNSKEMENVFLSQEKRLSPFSCVYMGKKFSIICSVDLIQGRDCVKHRSVHSSSTSFCSLSFPHSLIENLKNYSKITALHLYIYIYIYFSVCTKKLLKQTSF